MHQDTSHRLCGIVVLALVLVTALGACSLDSLLLEDDGSTTSWHVDDPFFEPGGFSHSEGHMSYQTESLVVSKTGIDVADHQGEIDWEAVAADGISFAFVRIGYRGTTEGNLYADELFEANLAEARAAGIECGVYFYSQATTEDEAHEEALYTLELLDSRELEYPVVFDYEPNEGDRLKNIGVEAATACTKAFCETIQSAGYQTMVYGNKYDLRHLDLEEIPNCKVWFAQYASHPTRTDPFVIWQYSSTGTVSGIDTSVCLDLDLSEALQ